ncbi:hypothetical protein [Nonomuraea zeae]|nr:hypothetical protein [Nonomuraea zeae]
MTMPVSRRVTGPGLPARPAGRTLIPYCTWANRGPHAKRVWIPELTLT